MSHPEAIKPLQSAHHPQREAWVEMQLISTFMRNARPAQYAVALMLAVVVMVLYQEVAPTGLWVWAAAVGAVTLMRVLVVSRFQRTMVGVSGAALSAFMAHYFWLWLVSGILWGASMFVFFLKAPIYDQFVCMLILAGAAVFAIGAYSSCLRCLCGYVDGLMGSALAALAYQFPTGRAGAATFNIYAMVALLLIYWVVIRVSGKRFHRVQRANLQLQFDNSELIASLTEKSRAALQAVEVKNRFIASAAHDLRQPVHALDLYAGWLAAEPQYVAQIAPKIVQSTRAVIELFNSLFDLAGLDSDPLRVNARQVDLVQLTRDMEVQYAPLASERGLRLKIRATAAQVWSDPVLLKRLIGNLLSNALKNTRQGGVLLATRRRHGVWCIEVWDTGVGIAREHQQAIFQEFYRIPLQGTEEGFGLGLAIVSRLSLALGHPVGMASRPGRGSVFWVALNRPAEAPAAAPGALPLPR